MDNSKNKQGDLLGVNKMGKNIRKSPLHQPNFANNPPNSNNNNATRQQPQPQVYNISKNDFRSVVQQLTCSPSHEPLPRPPQNPPKPQSMRLQKIRPPPLNPINPPHIPRPVPPPAMAQHPPPYNNSFVRQGPPPGHYGQPPPAMMPSPGPRDGVWGNTAESPISAYMRYLQTSMLEPSPLGNHTQAPLQHQQPPGPGQFQHHPQSSGLLPNPHMHAFPSPRMNGPVPPVHNLPSPRMNGPVPPMHNLPSPRMNGPALLPSPTSQFLLPSPTGYLNFPSPRSPYPLLSPGITFPPLTPNFAFSPTAQVGILGPGPQPPLSPGSFFPLSPSGFFPMSSPRWRDHY